jgi:DNA topoisomerase III
LPFIPESFRLGIREDVKSQLMTIKKLLNDSRITEVVNACDSGREGELIFDNVYRLCGSKKPVLRLWTASLTEEAIREAYSKMKPAQEYYGLRDSARSRSEADWIVGINGTRAQTLYCRKKGIELKRAANVGRVIIPVLYLIYSKDKSIKEFVSEKFWNIIATFEAPEGIYEGKWYEVDKEGKENDRKPTAEEANTLIKELSQQPANIDSVVQKEERRKPEQLYDLTTLQIVCNKRLGISAERTLEIAQALYETEKVATYPRTNSRHLSEDEIAKMPETLASLAKNNEYTEIISGLDTDQTLPKRFIDATKIEDHHAIIPTGKDGIHLTGLNKEVYDLIVRRTLAMYMPDRIDAKTTIITKIKDKTFKTTGTVNKQQGWTAVDPTGAKAKDESDQGSLPDVKEKTSPDVKKLGPKEGKTTPPKPFSEGELLNAMETAGKQIEDEELKAAMKDSGLGTPATRAATVEKLLSEGFIERKKHNNSMHKPR